MKLLKCDKNQEGELSASEARPHFSTLKELANYIVKFISNSKLPPWFPESYVSSINCTLKPAQQTQCAKLLREGTAQP